MVRPPTNKMVYSIKNCERRQFFTHAIQFCTHFRDSHMTLQDKKLTGSVFLSINLYMYSSFYPHQSFTIFTPFMISRFQFQDPTFFSHSLLSNFKTDFPIIKYLPHVVIE